MSARVRRNTRNEATRTPMPGARRHTIFGIIGVLMAVPGALVGSPALNAAADVNQDLAIAQEPLQNATDAIEDQIARRPDWSNYYGGAEIFVANKTATFYWARDSSGAWAPPGDFLTLVGSYDNNLTVNTTVTPSAYSLAALRTSAEAVSAGDASITAVSLESDSSGLVIEAGTEASAAEGNERLRGIKALPKEEVANNPLRHAKRYERGSAVIPALAVRQNDESAAPGRKGGARIRWSNPTGTFGICSTGFGVALSGHEYMITAAHCRAANVSTQDGGGQTIGTTTNRTPGNDYMWVTVSNASNRMFVGSWNNSTGSYKNVVGTVGNTKGTYTCQSGASTGVNCDTKIINENYYYQINGINQWGVRAERQSEVRAIGTGDSGGPVLKNTSNASNIKAAGIISAGRLELSCGSSAAPGTRCFKQVIYKRIQTARDNGTVVTS